MIRTILRNVIFFFIYCLNCDLVPCWLHKWRWYDFFSAYRTSTRNRTHASSVSPFQGTLIQDALSTKLHRQKCNIKYLAQNVLHLLKLGDKQYFCTAEMNARYFDSVQTQKRFKISRQIRRMKEFFGSKVKPESCDSFDSNA